MQIRTVFQRVNRFRGRLEASTASGGDDDTSRSLGLSPELPESDGDQYVYVYVYVPSCDRPVCGSRVLTARVIQLAVLQPGARACEDWRVRGGLTTSAKLGAVQVRARTGDLTNDPHVPGE